MVDHRNLPRGHVLWRARWRVGVVGCIAALLPALFPGPAWGAHALNEAVLAAAAVGATTGVVTVEPTRILDTRNGIGVAPHKMAAGEVLRLAIVEADGRGEPTGIPAVATAAILTFTASDAEGAGFITAWSCEGAPPATSLLNVSPNTPRANLAVAGLDGNGDLCVRSSVALQLTADVVGWVPAGAAFESIRPSRLYDSRSTKSLQAGRPLSVIVAGRAGVAKDARAAVVTVTGIGGSDGSFAVHPCGSAPGPSSFPLVGGEAVAATLVMALDDEAICITASVAGEVIVDVTGWFPSAANTPDLTARRLLELPKGGAAVSAVRIGGLDAGSGATTAVLSVSARGASGSGLVGVHSCDRTFQELGAAPLTTKLAIATFVVPLRASGLCVSATVPAELAVDVRAMLGPAASGTAPYAPRPPVVLPTGRSSVTRPFDGAEPADELAGAAWPGRFPQQAFGYVPIDQLPSQVGRLRIGDASGRAVGVCSATVVAPTLVLTAAHCVVGDDGQPFARWEFRPAQFGAADPTGSWVTTSAFPAPGYVAGSPTFDYALLRFDEVRAGRSVGDTVGWFPVGLGKAALGLSTVLLGYPVEGFFAGGCSGGNCYPWYCAGPPADAVSVTRQGVRSVGFGCVTAGGMSGGAVFAQVAGRWAVVSLVSVGPRFDSGGRPCSASPCFYGHNVIGPEFTAGFFDQLWEQASSVP